MKSSYRQAPWANKEVRYLRLNSLKDAGGVITVVSPSSLGGKQGPQGFHQWQVPELSEGTMALKPLTELRNGLLSSKACIQAPVFSDQSASRAELSLSPSSDSWQPAAVMSLSSFTAWMFTEPGMWRQNSVPTFAELTAHPHEIEGVIETESW